MSIKTLKKDELKIVAEEIGLIVPSTAKVIDLKTLIENSEIYKCDAEFVQNVIDNTLKEKEELKSDSQIKLELERIKLSQLEKEVELANCRKELPQSQISESDLSNRSTENLIKSVKTLTIPVPTKAESFNLFFQSIEKAFRTKNVPADLKAEILLNILGERVTNLMIYVKEEDVNNYDKLKGLILKEFQPTPQECLNLFRNAQKSPGENFVQYASRLSANFEYYCQLREVKDLNSLCELVVSDKLFCELERELKTHIAVKQGEKWFRPQELGRECDIYLSSKGKPKQDSFFAKSFQGVENKKGESNYANNYRNNSSRNFSNVYVSGAKHSKCILCESNENHKLYSCPKFKMLSVYERVEVVKNNKLCFKCFSFNCVVKRCRAKNCFCGKPHNQMIHFPRESNENKTAPKTDEAVATQCNASVSNFKMSAVLLLTCSVYASNSNEKLKFNKLIRLLCDNGSERSWCTKSLADSLKLRPIRRENLSVFSFGSTKPNEKTYDVAEINLMSRYDPNKFISIEILIVDNITAAPISVPNLDVQQVMKTKGLKLADLCDDHTDIELLIGADVFWQVVDSSGVEKIAGSITCVPTLFGFALQGAQGGSRKSESRIVATNFCGAADVQVLWELETLGIKEREEINKVDKAVVDQFERNLKFVNGRYETDLLWKINSDELGNNYFLAKKRFDELQKGFSKNEWVGNEYKEIISDQELKGVIEECKRDESEYFMPHRAVVREDKETTKVRVVFNCSSKSKGNFSLNDCLETGPNLNPNILDVILNFRKFKIAFNADIEKAFLMISISERDRKFLKFLWYSDNPGEECKFMRMKRLPFGCKTSPFILSATIKHHIKQFEENKAKSVEMLNSALYVDDLYYGANSVSEAVELSSDAVSILKSGGFNLRKLRSNSRDLEKLWIENGLSDGEIVGAKQLKVLGLNWNPERDELSLEMKGLVDSWRTLKNSKGCVLQTAARIFDPVGLIKLLLQEIWERAIDWDEELPAELREKWVNWCYEVNKLSEVAIPRNCLVNFEEEYVEMHVFCDASPSAYGAVVYLRFIRNIRGNKISSSFLEATEFRESHEQIMMLVQKVEYCTEIKTLESKRILKTSKLVQLNPFIDDCGLLRVGGRLKNSNLPTSVKHPLILPKIHPVTTMIVRYFHLTYLHGGVQLISSAIKQKYWITGLKSVIRKELRACVKRARYRLDFSKQIMADLPSARVNPGRAFLKCRTNYAGPFLGCPCRGRGVKSLKMCVYIFVCFTTKEVHLELVGDLSADTCNKWKIPSADLHVDDVLIKDESLRPLKWKIARVIHTYKGTDDRVIAVNLKTVSGEMKRPIHKLVRLPVHD